MRLLFMGNPSLNDYEDDEDYDFFYKKASFRNKKTRGGKSVY